MRQGVPGYGLLAGNGDRPTTFFFLQHFVLLAAKLGTSGRRGAGRSASWDWGERQDPPCGVGGFLRNKLPCLEGLEVHVHDPRAAEGEAQEHYGVQLEGRTTIKSLAVSLDGRSPARS